MRNPKVVLNHLTSKAKEEQLRIRKTISKLVQHRILSGSLCKTVPEQRKQYKGINEDTIDGMSVKRIERLIRIIKKSNVSTKSSTTNVYPKEER